mmetsp:Transcript_25841/g.65146  ORF Transcript_25841/g.65146 Transcript_25841/m.65146 type:complete len:1322 (+) Transcript_25841:220-4185(+)
MAAFERRRLPLAAVRLIAATSILSTLAAARDSSCVVDCVNGFCDEKLGVCQCRPNFGGESCNVLIGNEDTEFPHKFQGNGMTELPNYTRKYDEGAPGAAGGDGGPGASNVGGAGVDEEADAPPGGKAGAPAPEQDAASSATPLPPSPVSILSRAAHLKSSISKLFSKEDPDSSEARIAHIQALVQDDVREEDKEMALASKKRKKDAEVVESLSLHRQGEEKGENEDADRKKSQSTSSSPPSMLSSWIRGLFSGSSSSQEQAGQKEKGWAAHAVEPADSSAGKLNHPPSISSSPGHFLEKEVGRVSNEQEARTRTSDSIHSAPAARADLSPRERRASGQPLRVGATDEFISEVDVGAPRSLAQRMIDRLDAEERRRGAAARRSQRATTSRHQNKQDEQQQVVFARKSPRSEASTRSVVGEGPAPKLQSLSRGTSTARLPSTAAGAEKGATNKIRKLPEEILRRPNPHKKVRKAAVSFAQMPISALLASSQTPAPAQPPAPMAWPSFSPYSQPVFQPRLAPAAAMSSPVTTSKAGGLLVRGDEQRGSDQDQLQPTNTIVQQLLSAPLDEKVEVYGPRATALAATNAMKSLASSVGGPRQKLVVKKAPPARPRAAGVALLQMSGASTAGAGELQQLQQQQSAAPKPCSGHGNVTTIADGSAVCKCEPTHTGALCDTPRCTDDCNHQGLCVGGMCVCAPTSFGSFCQFKRCPHDCMGYGYCNLQGKCECNSGHSGEDCATVLAAGLVVTLSLDEAKPRASPAPNSLISTLRHVSEAKACADKDRCNMRGVCGNGGRCECYPGYSGDSCQQSCPNECSHNGHCMSGQCMCFEGFKGIDCAARSCCNGHGSCDQPGVCVCEAGYSGENCENRALAPPLPLLEVGTCDPACSANGVCSNGNCICKTGYIGATCATKVAASCPDNCNSRGLCLNGKCACDHGWQGEKCELQFLAAGAPAPEPGGAGAAPGGGAAAGAEAGGGGAAAITGLGGPLAETSDAVCGPDGGCSGHGRCDTVRGVCVCEMQYQGKFCEAPQCPGGWQPEIGGFSKSHGKFGKAAWHPCQGRGLCDGEGKCVCAAGYSGDDCGVRDCAFDCGAHGSCAAETATCSCETGWTGPNCRDPDCKNGCSGKGECVFAMNDSPGECRCAAGFAGDDCSVVSFETTLATCPNNCSGNGLCMAGTCSCSPGFFGAACEKEECEDLAMMGPNCDLPRCPNDCSAKGACMNGRCSCYAEFLGQDCSIPTTCYEPCKSKCEVDSGSETCRFCVGQCSSLANHPTLGHHSPFEDLQNSLLQSPSSSASAGGLKTTTLIQPASAHAEVYSKDVVYGM